MKDDEIFNSIEVQEGLKAWKNGDLIDLNQVKWPRITWYKRAWWWILDSPWVAKAQYENLRFWLARGNKKSKYWWPALYEYVDTCHGPGVVTDSNIRMRDVKVNGHWEHIGCVSKYEGC